MAHLMLRKSFLDRVEPLAVVYLAVAYVALTLALVHESGRFASALDQGLTQETQETQSSGLALADAQP